MNGDRINLSSDQPRLTNVARTDKLRQHRNEASRFTRAYQYDISQSPNDRDFTRDRDSQEIKVLGDQVRGHMEQMLAYLSEQNKLINSSNEKLLQRQERVEKSERNNNKLTLKWNADTNQNRQQGDIIEQAEIYINRLNNTKKFAFNEDFIKDWPNIKSTINKIVDKIKENGQLVHFIKRLGLMDQPKAKGKNADLDSQEAKLIELAHNHITHLDNAIKRAQQAEKSQHLEIELKKTREDNKALQLQKHSLERQLKQYLQEHEKLKRDNQERMELKEILKKAKPELSPEVKEAYNQLRDLDSQARHGYNVSNDEYRKLFEKVLGYLSPETLQDYEKRGVKLVVNPNTEPSYLVAAESVEDKWQVQLPLPCKNGIRGIILRTIDRLLETQQRQDKHIPPPERRAEIMARVFRANTMLGEYGFPLKDYEMAKKYHKDYKEGIHQAFKDGRISKDDPKEKLIEIGLAYADAKFPETIKPPTGIPRIFPSMQPASYFEESSIPELCEGRQMRVKIGSKEWDDLKKKLKIRQEERKNYVLTANVLADDAGGKEIWVQPYYILDGFKSGHPHNVRGNHIVWAGEVEIDYETNTVRRLKDQSGHYRTFDKDNPDLLVQFALETFKELGFNTSDTMIQLMAVEGPNNLEYHNYISRTRESLRNSGGLTPSEEYINKFRQNHGIDEIKDIIQPW